jgi:hypothetical protein
MEYIERIDAPFAAASLKWSKPTSGDIVTQMARLRKNETSVNIGPTAASAAPARRTAAPTPRTRTKAKTDAASTKPAPQEPVDLPTVSAVFEAAIIEYLPSHEEISARAYSYWVDRGYAEGSPEQDWLRAEAELRQRVLATA